MKNKSYRELIIYTTFGYNTFKGQHYIFEVLATNLNNRNVVFKLTDSFLQFFCSHRPRQITDESRPKKTLRKKH